MGRPERYIPENRDGVLVEVTCRTIGARALLLPAPNPRLFNEMVVGVIGRALEVSPVELCACVFLANHYHLLCVVHEQQALSRFMHHLGGNLSKEVGRVRQWRGALWERRYDGIPVSDEPEVQWDRLKYLLSHSVKEGLCESPLDWPGVHSAKALVHGEPLEGYWFNRSKECAARHRSQEYGTYDFATRYRVGLAPLPAFRHLAPDEYREKVAELIWEIEAEGRAARNGNSVAGVEKILRQDPYEPPTQHTKRSSKPAFHAKEREVRDGLLADRGDFQSQYREASEAYRGGRLDALSWFPAGSYPPALPFLGEPAPPRPPSPPTRRIEVLESGEVQRSEIPVVELSTRIWSQAPGEPRANAPRESRARGQPP